MENRWSHREDGTEVQRPGFEPMNELNPVRAYRADTEGPVLCSSDQDQNRAAPLFRSFHFCPLVYICRISGARSKYPAFPSICAKALVAVCSPLRYYYAPKTNSPRRVISTHRGLFFLIYRSYKGPFRLSVQAIGARSDRAALTPPGLRPQSVWPHTKRNPERNYPLRDHGLAASVPLYQSRRPAFPNTPCPPQSPPPSPACSASAPGECTPY